MVEFFRDLIWTFFGILIAVFLAIVIYFLQKSRKEISYEYTKHTLFSLKDEYQGKIQVLYNGKEIGDVYLIVATITNSGNTPVAAKDYETPLTLFFGEGSQVLTAEVTETSPENIQAVLHG